MLLADNNLPVMPLRSQEGDHLHSIAILTFSFWTIFSVFFAPRIKCLVTFLPVICLRIFLSGQVSKTSPLRLLTGGRGVGNPPNVSGQTGISLVEGLFFWNFFTNELNGTFFPCQRQGIPSKQEDTNIFILILL